MTAALRDAARGVLALEAGGTTTEALAAGAVSACEKISRRLAPLIGVEGVQSVFARALALTAARWPWLAAVLARSPDGSPTGLRAVLSTQRPDAVLDASIDLLATFVGLLETFIGAGLTARLLHDVWPENPLDRSSKESQ